MVLFLPECFIKQEPLFSERQEWFQLLLCFLNEGKRTDKSPLLFLW
jgi:hypothetical protein